MTGTLHDNIFTILTHILQLHLLVAIQHYLSDVWKQGTVPCSADAFDLENLSLTIIALPSVKLDFFVSLP